MAAHTPGPWKVHQRGSVRACDGRHDSDEGCRTLAEAEILGVPRAEAEANARLIAAAPDLLEALQALADDYDAVIGDGVTPETAPLELVAARVAIRKATGG